MSTPLSLEILRAAVAGGAVAIRSIQRLQPAGGPGDKVFPPTYTREGKAVTKYAMEERVINGSRVPTVLLDSVASQANRIEEALLEGYRRGSLRTFPLIEVDFSSHPELLDLDRLSSLQTPHRIADALLRDSVDAEGTPFRQTQPGREFTDSSPRNATGMFTWCPTALVFGCWDSTGPRGGMGSKFQRALVSEIVGINAVAGAKTASRIDPAGIEKKAGTIYARKDNKEEWTTELSEAAMEKGKPVLFSRSGGEKGADKGTPAGINHGNIPPSIDLEAGGVTMDYALHTIVLSLAGLRRLRFVTDTAGNPIPADKRLQAEDAARGALAALALAGVVYQYANGYDLRSRSLLVADEPLKLEVLARDGGQPTSYSLSVEQAAALLKDAAAVAAQHGLSWNPTPVVLKPAPKLAQLIKLSRTLAAAGTAEEEA
jgi:CRISPR-associated protein Csb1